MEELLRELQAAPDFLTFSGLIIGVGLFFGLLSCLLERIERAAARWHRRHVDAELEAMRRRWQRIERERPRAGRW